MDALKLEQILLELRSASVTLNANLTEIGLKEMMSKYNLLFLGSNVNCIYSSELAYSIKTVFNIPVEPYEVNELIPAVCNNLNMEIEPFINAEDVSTSNPKISCYKIVLW